METQELETLIEKNSELIDALHRKLYYQCGPEEYKQWYESHNPCQLKRANLPHPDHARQHILGIFREAVEEGATDIWFWTEAIAGWDPIYVMPGEHQKTLEEFASYGYRAKLDTHFPSIKYQKTNAKKCPKINENETSK